MRIYQPDASARERSVLPVGPSLTRRVVIGMFLSAACSKQYVPTNLLVIVQCSVVPPFTEIFCPVTKRAPSDAR